MLDTSGIRLRSYSFATSLDATPNLSVTSLYLKLMSVGFTTPMGLEPSVPVRMHYEVSHELIPKPMVDSLALKTTVNTW